MDAAIDKNNPIIEIISRVFVLKVELLKIEPTIPPI